MAMARSLAPLLLLLSVLVATAAAARSVGDVGQEACSKTQFPKLCADALATKPESKAAEPRRLAELFAGIAAEKGKSMATLLHGKTSPDKAVTTCYDSCGDDVEEAMAHLNGLLLAQWPTDDKFLELKSWLSSTLGGAGASTCEEACKDLPKSTDKDEVVSNSVEFEKLLRVTLDLLTQAFGSRSRSAAEIALPPSDAAAPSYGAAAPPFGGDAASSAEAPAAAAASQDGAASAPSADSPASDAADAPSGSSSAPAPSSGPSADAPSATSSGAPAPDDGASGDDGDDDSDDKA